MGKKSGTNAISAIIVPLMLFGAFLSLAPGSAVEAQDGDCTYAASGSPAVANITGYTSTGGASLAFAPYSVLPTIDVSSSITDHYEVATNISVGCGASCSTVQDTSASNDTIPPVVAFTIFLNGIDAKGTAQENETLVFSGNATYDANDSFSDLTFAWTFGDGQTATGAWTTHMYTSIMTFFVKLEVTDKAGNKANATKSLVITSQPRPDLRILSMSFDPDPMIEGEPGSISVNLTNVGDADAVSPLVEFFILNGDGTTDKIGESNSMMIEGMANVTLMPGMNGVIAIGWIPSLNGNYVVVANASVSMEIARTDNAFTKAIQVDEPPIMIPSAPRDLTTTPGIENVTLTWDPPLFSNSSVTGYLISYGTTPDNLPNQIAWDQLIYVLEGLTKGQAYFFKVTAHNNAGWGPNSTVETATPFNVPSMPIGLTAEAGNSYVQLSWGAPSYAGPGTLVYHLFRNGSLLWSGPSLTHNDTTVVSGSVYAYRVAASNFIGWGENTTDVNAMPPAPGPSGGDDMTSIIVAMAVIAVVGVAAALSLLWRKQ